MLFLLGRINWKPGEPREPWNAVEVLGVLFCHVECLDAWGNSCWRMPAQDEPCSCSISWRILVEELILYVE